MRLFAFHKALIPSWIQLFSLEQGVNSVKYWLEDPLGMQRKLCGWFTGRVGRWKQKVNRTQVPLWKRGRLEENLRKLHWWHARKRRVDVRCDHKDCVGVQKIILTREDSNPAEWSRYFTPHRLSSVWVCVYVCLHLGHLRLSLTLPMRTFRIIKEKKRRNPGRYWWHFT